VQAVLPYSHYLGGFPAYLQQLVMESNGKSVGRDGRKLNYATSGVVFGEPGTNGQHAFFQLLHQGTQIIPADFIAFAQTPYSPDQNELLLANFFAQTKALMKGKSIQKVEAEFEISESVPSNVLQIMPHKVFEGGRPSTSFLFKRLTPRNLGSLIAAYEHKVFVEGVIWNIFSFDQWGVELGKQLAEILIPELNQGEKISSHDSSTNGLMNYYLANRIKRKEYRRGIGSSEKLFSKNASINLANSNFCGNQ
jgi:glucose-6-phosphate isomerase